jgi:hypothetical protein
MTTSDEQQADLSGRVPEHADLLVVGGGPAALAAATGYRDHGGEGTVVLVSDDDTLPYFRPPLSKDYLRGETEEADLLIEPESAYEDADIEARLNVMVTALDAGERTAMLSDGAQLTYEHCVLATGAAPKPLPVPGADDPRVAYLRTLDSARTLRTAAEAVRSAVVARLGVHRVRGRGIPGPARPGRHGRQHRGAPAAGPARPGRRRADRRLAQGRGGDPRRRRRGRGDRGRAAGPDLRP